MQKNIQKIYESQPKYLRLDDLVEMYKISKPTLLKIKEDHNNKYKLELTADKPKKILNTEQNHKIFAKIVKNRGSKYQKLTNIEVNWSPLISHPKIFKIPIELYFELTQNKAIPLHIDHQIEEAVEIIHKVDTNFFEEINKKKRYSNLITYTFNKTISEIKDRKIEKINIADLSFQLGYTWPKLTEKIRNKIQHYIDIDQSLVRFEQVVLNKNHKQLEKWTIKDKEKVKLGTNNITDKKVNRIDLLRDLYQKQVFTKKNDTSTIHFVFADHLYSRSGKDGRFLISNVRRSMDLNDYMILVFMIPSKIEKIKERFDTEKMEEGYTYTLRKVLNLQMDEHFVLNKQEITENGFKIYAQITKNVKIHFGNLENSYGKLEMDRDLILYKNDKILLTQRYYFNKKEIENILLEFGFETVYYDFDSIIKMGVFVCNIA